MFENVSSNADGSFGDDIREKVTINHWARNRRQKVLRDISFESGSPYNIYDPHFTSEDDDDLGSLNEHDIKMIKNTNYSVKSLT